MSNEFDNEVVNRRSNWSLFLKVLGVFFMVLSVVLGSLIYFLDGNLNLAIGSFIFAFSDVERARLLVSKGGVNPNKPHMFFVIGFSGAALVFVLMSNVAISVLALNLIVLLLYLVLAFVLGLGLGVLLLILDLGD